MEVFEDETCIYLILELCATDMQKYLNIRQQFTEEESKTITCFLVLSRTAFRSLLASARHYIKQILGGMEYLHSHQILHRDLKLHNLLLTKDNNVVSARAAF